MIAFRSILRIAATVSLAASSTAPVMAQSPGSPAPSPSASSAAGPAITVVAKDYRFEGLPTTVPAGTTFTLDNQGTEVHELIVVRRNDGVTQTWDELLALPEDQVNQYITFVGQVMAAPGTVAEGDIVVDQQGDYFAGCFVPQGTTTMPDPSASPAASAPTGTPHFMLGMRQEFTVTAAGTPVGPLPSLAPTASVAPAGSAAPVTSPGALAP